MKAYYKNNLKQAQLILESEKNVVEEYQLSMIRENEIPGILKMNYKYVDGMIQYYYDISGKTSLQIFHEKTSLCVDDIKSLAEDMLQTIKELQRYMLPSRCLLMDPEYIFCEKDKYFFCFFPPEDMELKDKFHKLTEFLVREVDYRDEEGVRLAYMLHKASMEENCTIEKVLEDFEEEEKELDYMKRMEEMDMDKIMIAEKAELWEPIRKLLERRKKTCK